MSALTLIVAVLLAQPLPREPLQESEKVAIVARSPAAPAGFFSRLKAGAQAAARRLYEKEEPNAARANALLAEGKAQAALDAYDQVQVPDDSPAEGAVAFDRSGALLKLGAESAPKAVQEASRAMDKGAASLKPQAAYQLGLGFEQLGKPDEAMTAYAQALQLDPEDEDAKVNLELLLRSKKEEKKDEKSQDGEKKEKKEPQKSSDAKDEQKQQGGKDQDQKKKPQDPGAQKKDEPAPGKPQEEKPGEKKEENQGQAQNEKPGEEKKGEEGQAGKPQQLDRSEAQRLLDALRAGEKNLQVWRFAQKKIKEGKRPDAAKDW